MVTHWESSRRPLYVRTIWKDGQHHVILDKTKEKEVNLSTYKRSKQCSSSQSTHRTSKSASTGVNLKVSSVRVLLSGIKTFKYGHKESRIRQKSNERPKTWTGTINRCETCKNSNKEVAFSAVRGLKPPNLYKSNTLNSDLNESHIQENFHTNILDNALSEKVLIWLDLATNNSQLEKEIRAECTVTAQPCHIASKWDKQFEHACCNEDTAEEIVDSSILKNTSPRYDEKGKETVVVYSNEETETPRENFYHVLTPTVNNEEFTYREEPVEEKIEMPVNSVKRQLHIFMPNLPKKSSDCDSSIFSSKISVN